MRFGRGVLGWVVFIGLALLIVYMLQMNKQSYTKIGESELFSHMADVQSIEIDTDEVNGAFMKPITVPDVHGNTATVANFNVQLQPGESSDWAFHEKLLNAPGHPAFRNVNNQNFLLTILAPFIPWLLVLGRSCTSSSSASSATGQGPAACSATSAGASTRSRPRSTPTSPSMTWPASRRPRKR